MELLLFLILIAILCPAVFYYTGIGFIGGVAAVLYMVWWVLTAPVNLLLWICGERK